MHRSAPSVRLLCVPILVHLASPAAALAAQDPVADLAERQLAAARAIELFARDFERGQLHPNGPLRSAGGLQPDYVAAARAAGLGSGGGGDRLTHLDALQKLLFFAESNPSSELAEAVLGLAAAGLDGAFLDRDALLLRPLVADAHGPPRRLVRRAARGRRRGSAAVR
jgi:hypothetical protein